MGWTTTELLAAIKRRASIPTTAGTYSNTALLAMADEESDAHVVPRLVKTGGEYLVKTYDYAIVGEQAAYRIPPRAVAVKLRDAILVDSNGDETSLRQIEPEHKIDAQYRASSDYFEGVGLMFYIEADHIKLAPTPSSNHTSYTLRLPYYRRPNRLVETTACALIASRSGAQVTINGTIPSTMVANATCDIIRGKPGFDWLNADLVIQSVSAPTITFTTSVSTDIAAGDYVAVAEQTPIAQIPPELHRLLAQYTALQVLENQGDTASVQLAKMRLGDMLHELETLLTPRVDGEPSVCVNRHSTFSAARGVWWR